MKTIKRCFFFLSLSIIIASCGTDDDSNSPFELTAENFSGTYDITTLITTDTESFTTDGTTTTNTYVSVGSDFNTTWTFADNGTLTVTGNLTITDSGEENGEPFNEVSQAVLNENGTYALDVENVTVLILFQGDDEDEAQLFDIISFSEDTISLRSEQSQVSTDFSSEFISEIVLERK